MFLVINILQISSGIHRSQARTWNTTSWHQELYNRANNGLFWAKPRLHCHQGSILTFWLHWCGIFGRKNSMKTPLFVLTSSVSRFNWFRYVKSNANYEIYRLNLSLEICFLFRESLIIPLYWPTAEKQRPKGKFLRHSFSLFSKWKFKGKTPKQPWFYYAFRSQKFPLNSFSSQFSSGNYKKTNV